ncbi:MAG: hypothetical protein JXQ96_09645 [Cyclobacteriaceae bacterium]
MKTKKANTITRCKFFRAKSPMFGAVPGGASHFDLNSDNLASCWCVKTSSPMAPDGGYVDPARCISGRGCFAVIENSF